jgi:SAM-dependent methyltransferase
VNHNPVRPLDTSTVPRDYYEEAYHFDEDVERPNLARLWRAMRGLQPLAGQTFLDLGSGVGWATHLALTRGGASLAVGLDFSWRALALAARHTPQAKWVHGDGNALPFANGAFDSVFSFGSMEHFPDVAGGFRELHRILRTGGRAVIVVPNFWVRTDQPQEFRGSQREWTRLIRGAGLEIVDVGTDYGPSILKNRKPLRILLRLLVRLVSFLPPLRYQFVFVLEKADPESSNG